MGWFWLVFKHLMKQSGRTATNSSGKVLKTEETWDVHSRLSPFFFTNLFLLGQLKKMDVFAGHSQWMLLWWFGLGVLQGK